MRGRRERKKSPRLKIAAKFNRGMKVRVQPGQSLISDHFTRTPGKGDEANSDDVEAQNQTRSGDEEVEKDFYTVNVWWS